ncbi:MAG: hypothetical protein MUC97_09125 [Bernardetiaceae bacterium]|jgi:hypothetical protein|nr:hypothetical protein [Bernardetiaceae bacterium]
MNKPLSNYHRYLSVLPLVILVVGGLAWALARPWLGQPVLPAIGLLGTFTAAFVLMILENVRRGKPYAAGAKKRRKRVFPLLYGRKPKTPQSV